jgi:hypothetical protein
MKTAVLFFGEVRGDPEHWQQIYNKIVQPNNADVFMYLVYYDKDYFNNMSFKEKDYNEAYYKNRGMRMKPPAELFDIMKPVKIVFEAKKHYPIDVLEQINDRLNPYYDLYAYHDVSIDVIKHNWYRIISQNELRKKVTELKIDYEKENNFKYDNVIMTRLDIDPVEDIIISAPLTNIFAKLAEHPMLQGGCIHEQILIGKSELMDVFKDIYPEIFNLIKEHCSYDNHYKKNELYISLFLKSKGIDVEHFDMPLSYYKNNNGLCQCDFSIKNV